MFSFAGYFSYKKVDIKKKHLYVLFEMKSLKK